MTNIFLLYRPFHADYCLEIVRQQQLDACVFVNHYSAQAFTTDLKNSQTINFAGGIFNKIRQTREAKKLIEQVLAKGATRLFMPHTLGLLANYSYYRLWKKHPQLQLVMFYEGIIMFYDYHHSYFQNIRYYISRFFVALLCGFLYTPQKKLMDLFDERIKMVVTPFDSVNAPKGKISLVSLPQIEYQPDVKTCMILGLRIHGKPEKESVKIIEAIFNRVRDLGFQRVLFKDHPAEPNPLFNSIAEKFTINLEIITEKVPAERLVSKYRPATIISIWSSALINLRGSLKATVTIESFVSDAIVESPEHKKILSKFEESGIRVTYC